MNDPQPPRGDDPTSQLPDATALSQRITDYLSIGGLFNPEMAIHERVRDLLIECRTELDAASQRPRKENAQEWTPERIERYVQRQELSELANEINAAIDAAHRKYKPQVLQDSEARVEELEQQLAAEREKREQSDLRESETEERLLIAQAAIAELQNVIEGEKISFNLHEQIRKCLRVDLSALDKHDEEVSAKAWNEGWEEGAREARKPLVELLRKSAKCMESLAPNLTSQIKVALAKIQK